MTRVPEKAFVLAAGMGLRMRPLTDNCPKPLLEIGGATMLDRALDALAAAGVREAAVNAHYLPGMIAQAVEGRKSPAVTLLREEKLLETGGGVRAALDVFGDAPFFVLNADVVWEDGPVPALARLADAWDGAAMDALLLLHPGAEEGDYYLPAERGRPVFRTRSPQPADHTFTGLRIVHPRLFTGETRERFSFIDLFHRAEAAGRLHGLRHDGAWHHVGTPEEYAATNALFSARMQEKKRAP